MSDKLTLKTEGETQIVATRRFSAPPEAVYRAHTDPELVQQWLLGPEGWTMPVCINEATPGGRFRYELSDGTGQGFYITGEFLELDPPRRIVHVERMFLPARTPDNHVETRFEPDGTDADDHAHDLARYANARSYAGYWNGARYGGELCQAGTNDSGCSMTNGSSAGDTVLFAAPGLRNPQF